MLVSLKGALVSLAALDLKATINDQVSPDDKLVIDLRQVTDVDTTGLNTLYQTRIRCDIKNADMILKLTNCHPLKELMSLMMSESHFEIEHC